MVNVSWWNYNFCGSNFFLACVCLFKHQVDFLFSFVLNDDDRYLSLKRKMKLKLVKQIRWMMNLNHWQWNSVDIFIWSLLKTFSSILKLWRPAMSWACFFRPSLVEGGWKTMPPKWLEMERSSIQSVRRPSLLALQDAGCLQEAFRWVRKRLARGLSPHYQC